MARSKPTVSLFDVLHRDPKAVSLKTPPWWYKNRPPAAPPIQKSVVVKAVDDPPPPPVEHIEQREAAVDPALPQMVGDAHPTNAAVEMVPVVVATIASSNDIPVSLDDPTLQMQPTLPVDASDTGQSWMDDLRRILTPTSIAMIASFAVVLLIATLLVGRLRNKSYVYASMPTDQLRTQPPRPGVMSIGTGAASSSANSSVAGSGSTAHVPAAARSGATAPIVVTNPNDPASGANPPLQTARIVGLNYVVVSSFYPSQKQDADNACQFLVSQGIGCTVEVGVPGWGQHYCVVSTDGFTRPGSPDCQALMQKIMDLNRPGVKPGSYNAFNPTAVKWKLVEPAAVAG